MINKLYILDFKIAVIEFYRIIHAMYGGSSKDKTY